MFDRKRANEEVLSVIFPLAKFEIRQYVCVFIKNNSVVIFTVNTFLHTEHWLLMLTKREIANSRGGNSNLNHIVAIHMTLLAVINS